VYELVRREWPVIQMPAIMYELVRREWPVIQMPAIMYEYNNTAHRITRYCC